MSLNFDVNSNLSLVRRFHTMNKMCQFYSDSSRFFFATNCTSDTLIFSLQEALEFVSRDAITPHH
jgi:hypothetical protein